VTISGINIFDRAGMNMTGPRHAAALVGLISEFEHVGGDIGAEKDSGLGDSARVDSDMG